YALFRRAVGDALAPVWPEKWPRERLAERRREIGEVAFARAYRLACVPDGEVAIRPEWVTYWHERSEYESVVLAVDPAATANARSDASALVLLGLTPDGYVDCLAATAVRVPASELVR